jgi:hypothetical protein
MEEAVAKLAVGAGHVGFNGVAELERSTCGALPHIAAKFLSANANKFMALLVCHEGFELIHRNDRCASVAYAIAKM